MRAGRILGFVVGGVVALAALVPLIVWLSVDPNHFKPRIASAFKESTGRDLELQGDIKLSVFPWIALELGPATLGNPPGFGEQPFVAWRHVVVRVKLLPLLRQRLEIGRIELDGLDVRLARNAAGKGNWEGFGSGREPPAPAHAAQVSGFEGLAGIRVQDARVSYRQITIEKFNLETGAFAAGGTAPIAISFGVDRGIAGEQADVVAKFDVSIDANARGYQLHALDLSGHVNRPGSMRPLSWTLTVPELALNLATQTLAAPALAANLAGAQLSGRLAGTQILDDLSLTGAFTLAPLELRELLTRLGMSAPKTQDPRALAQLSAAASFSYGGHGLVLDPLQVTLDDTTVRGRLGVANPATLALTFELAADRFDVDRYLAPPELAPLPGPAPAPPAQPRAAEAGQALEAHGTLTLAAVHWSRLDFKNWHLTVAAKDHVLHVFPSQAELNGGHYTGDLTLDSRGSVPSFSVDEHLTGIDLSTLVTQRKKGIRVSGRATLSLTATARGSSPEGILKSLNGRGAASLSDGALEGVDLTYVLGQGQALMKHELSAGTDTGRTPFGAFKGSAQITNGVADIRDLALSSPYLRVTGQGTADLSSRAIDFQLLAQALNSATLKSTEIPVRATGTLSEPTLRPDIEALAKGQLKQKLQDVLKDKLKGLFGKP